MAVQSPPPQKWNSGRVTLEFHLRPTGNTSTNESGDSQPSAVYGGVMLRFWTSQISSRRFTHASRGNPILPNGLFPCRLPVGPDRSLSYEIGSAIAGGEGQEPRFGNLDIRVPKQGRSSNHGTYVQSNLPDVSMVHLGGQQNEGAVIADLK